MTQNPNAPGREPDTEATIHKEREIKDDGRYIIFYTFEEEPEEEGED